MTFEEQWRAIEEASFCAWLSDGAHKSASAQTADSRRISDLEAAVAEIQEAMQSQIELKRDLHKTRVLALTDELDARSKHAEEIAALKAELRKIHQALDDPRVDLTMTASEVVKELRSALKVIHTWASFPESFDLDQTKRLCMSALGREQ